MVIYVLAIQYQDKYSDRHLGPKEVHQGITGFDDRGCFHSFHAGVPLSTDLQGNLSILESNHNAGIRHGDIRPEVLLIGDMGVTTRK